jgi:dUTP pyrophosphatase
MENFHIYRTEDAKDLPIPSRATEKSAGLDLYANITEQILVYHGGIKLIPCGIKLIIPDNYEVQIRPRSGIAYKNGVTVLNSPGTIDGDYRGEISVILINHGYDIFTINRGDRIAQMVLCPVSYMNPEEIDKEVFEEYSTDRGSGGFGHTGV